MKINRFAKRVSAVIAGLALSIVLAPACAEKIDFDQGVDASQILSDIRQQIPLALIDKASLFPVLSVTKEPDFTILGAVIGMDLRTRLAQSGPYKTAAKYPPLIETLPPDVRDPLKAEWASISTIWNGLFTEATGLEAEDDRLYARAEALDRNAERLKRNGEKLEVEIGNFNRQCTGRPLPPDEYKACIRWQDDLKKRIGAHNAEVEKHNNAAIQWRSDVTDLRRRAGTEQAAAKQKISPWLPRVTGVEGQRLAPFSSAAQKALDRHGPGKCDLEEFDRRVRARDEICRKAKPCDETMRCADLGTQLRGNEACYEAAKKVVECLDGGDSEHARRMEKALAELNRCKDIFKAKCSGWDPITGMCDEPQHALLQREVDFHCHGRLGGRVPVSCDPQSKDCDGEDGHRVRLGRWNKCIGAREAINELCYEGGDEGHRQQLRDVRIAAGRCETIISRECPRPPAVLPP